MFSSFAPSMNEQWTSSLMFALTTWHLVSFVQTLQNQNKYHCFEILVYSFSALSSDSSKCYSQIFQIAMLVLCVLLNNQQCKQGCRWGHGESVRVENRPVEAWWKRFISGAGLIGFCVYPLAMSSVS